MKEQNIESPYPADDTPMEQKFNEEEDDEDLFLEHEPTLLILFTLI